MRDWLSFLYVTVSTSVRLMRISKSTFIRLTLIRSVVKLTSCIFTCSYHCFQLDFERFIFQCASDAGVLFPIVRYGSTLIELWSWIADQTNGSSLCPYDSHVNSAFSFCIIPGTVENSHSTLVWQPLTSDQIVKYRVGPLIRAVSFMPHLLLLRLMLFDNGLSRLGP